MSLHPHQQSLPEVVMNCNTLLDCRNGLKMDLPKWVKDGIFREGLTMDIVTRI
jgi:hypothetical protein